MSLPSGRPRRPENIPAGDAGDEFDPKPTRVTRCSLCSARYPLGKLCGYCRAAMRLYQATANSLLRPQAGPRTDPTPVKLHVPPSADDEADRPMTAA